MTHCISACSGPYDMGLQAQAVRRKLDEGYGGIRRPNFATPGPMTAKNVYSADQIPQSQIEDNFARRVAEFLF